MSLYSSDTKVEEKKGPVDAATVILLREKDEKQFELFLMKRHRAQSFMAGAYVFPGGKLDNGDRDEELLDHVLEFNGRLAREQLQEPELDEHCALALYLCAIRELFEETGVLLADSEGRKLTDCLPELLDRRITLQNGEQQFTAFAKQEKLSFLPGNMIPYSRWITPVVEPKRFDTRFFLARLPKGQQAKHDGVELIDSIWLTPEEALKRQKKDKLLLMPPTLLTIEELCEFETVEQAFEQARRARIFPLLPEAFAVEGGVGVRLPYDPQYSNDQYRQPPRRQGSTCIMLIDGKWETAGPAED
jgi:8-oxo-dGTP pyrophosphatase MutT (NUDIX family)